MKTLGIDYGRSKIGVAIADGTLSEPLQVIHYKDLETFKHKLGQIVKDMGIEKVVVGVSEGAMAEETKNFVKTLSHWMLPVTIETFDETLTSRDAQNLSIAAGVPQKKRHQMEDAYAASIMLQNYLDSNKP